MSEISSVVAPTVAVVGTGYWGKNLVRNFAELKALSAITDLDVARASALASEHNVPVRLFSELLDDPRLPAIAIAAPAAQHYRLASEALAAGKDVFVEKPLALTSSDGEALCRQAEAQGRILMVGHLLQYHPAFQRLQELVDNGALGRVQYLYSNRLNFGKIRREEDILWSFAPHDLSMILSLVHQEPNRVTAMGSSYLHRTIADVTVTHLSFPGGETAHIFVSWLHPSKEQRLVVVGDRAMAVFDDGEPWAGKLQVYDHRVNWHAGMPQPVKAQAKPVPLDEAEPLRLECEQFLDAVNRRCRPRTDGWEGLRVLRVLETASKSMNSGDGASRAAAAPPAEAPSARAADFFLHKSAYVDEGVIIGSGSRIWHFCHILSGTTIGQGCTIGQNVMIGPDVVVGNRCKIQNNVSLYRGVRLSDGVFCGPSCVFTNVLNPRAEVERKDEFRSTLVGRGATIGANATILCGNRIGEYAMIGAGAVVTSEVPPHALMVGIPARRRGWVSHDGEILAADLVCRSSGRRYHETGPDCLEEIV